MRQQYTDELQGITDLRDESSREGMRIVMELRRDAIPRVVLNQLYKHTSMQSTFGVIMLALVPDPQTRMLSPKGMGLREVLDHYIEHRHEVIVRRAQFEFLEIRAQMQAVGFPLIGDGKYGTPVAGLRLLLHAARITLPDGRSFSCPPPWPEPWKPATLPPPFPPCPQPASLPLAERRNDGAPRA